MPPKRPTSFLLHPKYQVVNCVTGKTAVRAVRAQGGMYQRAGDPTNSFADCIRKPIPELLGMPHLWISTTGPQAPPPTLHVPYPCTSPWWPHIGPAPVYSPEAVRMNFCRQ